MPLTQMPMTRTFAVPTMQAASSTWRKPVAVGLVAVLHVVMFYGFTHGIKIASVFVPDKPFTLVSVPPVPVTPPETVKAPADPAPVDRTLSQAIPITADQPYFTIESTPVVDAPPQGVPSDDPPVGAGPVLPESRALVITHRVDPAYPAAARRAGEEGTVLLSVRVDPNGLVSAVSILRSSGSLRLDDAARDAVKRWRFAARQSGTVEVNLPISFRLESVRF